MPHRLAKNIVVLKFGSSVLTDAFATRSAVAEIYRHIAMGRRVVAIVSALAGETDRLSMVAEQFGHTSDGHYAGFLATGEQQASYLLGLAADDVGLKSAVVSPKDLKLTIAGDTLDALPISYDQDYLLNQFIARDLLIVPGFYGIRENGRMGLLGRGGSDLTAIYLASQLDDAGLLERCKLVKDVEGVYNKDPNKFADGLELYQSLTYETAAAIAGVLVQPKSVVFARQHDLAFEVGRVGIEAGTRIGHYRDVTKPVKQKNQPLRVALAGLGVVGYGVYQQLCKTADVEVTKILVSDTLKHAEKNLPEGLLTTNARDLEVEKVDILLECLSVKGLAIDLISKALKAGTSVVSANKQAIVSGYHDFKNFAAQSGAGLAFSASVGGGVPILESIDRSKEIVRVSAVLNGTTNYVYSRMAEGLTADVAIKEAQDLGFAEADPSADIDGFDALAKISLIAVEGAPVSLSDLIIDRADFDSVTVQNDESYRQICQLYLKDGQYHVSVKPESLTDHSKIGKPVGAENIAIIDYSDGSQAIISGLGAGRWPTTHSMINDFYQLLNERASLVAKSTSKAA